MKKIMLRAAAAVLAAAVVLLSGGLSAYALVPVFEPSSAYAQSEYYQRLIDVELTGDPRQDIVAVALSQLGYREGGMAGDNSGSGRVCNNYTEYGYCMGNDGSIWCTTFIWWCARQVGLDASVFPDTIWPRLLTVNIPYVGYTPTAQIQPGDILFVENSGDDTSDHLALVVEVTDSTIVTVEGNCGHVVCKITYQRDIGGRADGMGDILYIGYLNYDKDPSVPDASAMAQYALLTEEAQIYNKHTGGDMQGVAGAGEICPLLAIRADRRCIQIERGGLAYWIDASKAVTGNMDELLAYANTDDTTTAETTRTTTQPSQTATQTEEGGIKPSQPAENTVQTTTTTAPSEEHKEKKPFIATPEGELLTILSLLLVVVVVFITLLAVSGKKGERTGR